MHKASIGKNSHSEVDVSAGGAAEIKKKIKL